MGRKEQWTFKPLEIILVGRGKIATVVMVEVGGGSEETTVLALIFLCTSVARSSNQ